MHRLRKALGYLQQAGNKPGQKQTFERLIPSVNQGKKDVRYLELLIVNIEAEWAFAMDMKKASAEQEG